MCREIEVYVINDNLNARVVSIGSIMKGNRKNVTLDVTDERKAARSAANA